MQKIKKTYKQRLTDVFYYNKISTNNAKSNKKI